MYLSLLLMTIPKQLLQYVKLSSVLDAYKHSILVVTLGILVIWDTNAQDKIIDDGQSYYVSAVGTYKDLILPENPLITDISFDLEGGDGGFAYVLDIFVTDWNGTYSYISYGGEGATIQVTFQVGNDIGEIPLGSTIRFVEGARGSNMTLYGTGTAYGGGGGGTAVLYDPPGPEGWKLLAVAGGGGGAFQTVITKDAYNGEDGGGSYGLGGRGGSGGDGTNYSGGGGGVLTAGGNISMACGSSGGGAGENSIGIGGSSAGCSIPSSPGGSGFGGGGAGAGAGGGGGGYSGGGGGGGDFYEIDGVLYASGSGSGDGGGSYINPLASNPNIAYGYQAENPENGEISYQVNLNEPPIASCTDATIYLDAQGYVNLQMSQIESGSSDPDGSIISKVLSQTLFSCSHTGDNQVQVIVTDNEGGRDTCTSTVTVLDTIAPVAVCRDVTLTLNLSGEESIQGYVLDGGSTDACGIDYFESSKTDFTIDDIGVNTVILTVTDYNGNQSTCPAMVTVPDNVPPVAHCREEITVPLDWNGTATIHATQVDNGSTDNEGIQSVQLNDSIFTCNDIGPNQVILTVTDINGNMATCTTTVNVVDVTAPSAFCWQNRQVYLDASGKATLNPLDLDAGSSDICGIASRALDITEVSCVDVGNPVTVKLTITDKSGNQISCQPTITVMDTVSPTVITRNMEAYLDENGHVLIGTDDINNNSLDACGIASMELDVDEFTCTDLGDNTVRLTVTDVHGNSRTGSATVTVLDTISPKVQCKEQVAIYLNSMGKTSIEPSYIVQEVSDNCTDYTLSLDRSDFDCEDLGEIYVELTATDNSGNASTCTTTIVVLDTLAPLPNCKDEFTVYLNAMGEGTMTSADVDDGSTDNCGIRSLKLNDSIFYCSDLGENEVVMKVTDLSGNSDSCTIKVMVLDTISPTVQCVGITVYLDTNGVAVVSTEDVHSGSSDNCGIRSVKLQDSILTCESIGTETIRLIATDLSGNTGVCAVVVTVKDTIAPNVHTRDVTINLNAAGQASLTATSVNNDSRDACGIGLMEVFPNAFTRDDLGPNTVVLKVTDPHGNIDSATARVMVEEAKPIVRTQDVTVVLDKYGVASLDPEDIDAGSTVVGSVKNMWLEGLTTFDCGSVGVHGVVLFVEDQNGNIDRESARVTVKFYEPVFTNIHGVANGDTVHLVDCLPWSIEYTDLLDHREMRDHGAISTAKYRVKLPDNPPWPMYELWRYEYLFKDACYHTRKFTFYLALYDLAPPGFHSFPDDTTVATVDDVPEVDEDVRIIDICQYVVWDTVMTMPILDSSRIDTIGFTRRWMARDPVGHENFRDQMIWIGSGDRNQYGLITGRIADEDHIRRARFAGEAGTNGLAVSLYRIDESPDSLVWVDNWTTGDWQGEQGKYYFVLEHPGLYRVRIDTLICLVDTVKFDKYLWSDTLDLSAGMVIDQGWIITHPCAPTDSVVMDTMPVSGIVSGKPFTPVVQEESILHGNDILQWNIYPNPATGYVRIDVQSDAPLEFRVYDALGRIVKSGPYRSGHTIEIRNLNTGVHHIQLANKNGILGTKKLLIME